MTRRPRRNYIIFKSGGRWRHSAESVMELSPTEWVMLRIGCTGVLSTKIDRTDCRRTALPSMRLFWFTLSTNPDLVALWTAINMMDFQLVQKAVMSEAPEMIWTFDCQRSLGESLASCSASWVTVATIESNRDSKAACSVNKAAPSRAFHGNLKESLAQNLSHGLKTPAPESLTIC